MNSRVNAANLRASALGPLEHTPIPGRSDTFRKLLRRRSSGHHFPLARSCRLARKPEWQELRAISKR